MKKILFVLGIVSVLAGCGGGGTADSSTAFRAEYASSCDTNSNVLIKTGNYTFTTNPWGKGSMVNFTNCITGNTVAGGGVVGRINWDWVNLHHGVKSYPEIMYRPNGQPPNIVINEINSLYTSFNVSVTATGDYNIAYDLWIDSSKQVDHWPHKAEVMIKAVQTWTDSPVVDTVTVNGIVFDVVVTTSQYQTDTWPLYIFQAKVPLYQATLQLKPFFDYLTSRNYLSGTDVISTIEFGSEIMHGTGIVTVNSFEVVR